MSPLPEELTTGVSLIDNEHEHLFVIEQGLAHFCDKPGEPCATCEPAARRQCDTKLSRSFEHLLNYMTEHFRSEEKLMGCLPPAIAQAHKHDHAELSHRFASLIGHSAHTDMLVSPGELHQLVGSWLHEHVERWDLPLARQIGICSEVPQT